MFGRLALLLACGVLTASPCAAQAPSFDRYSGLVNAYRSGDVAAVTGLATWAPADIERMLAPAAAGGPRFTETAALLHADVAIASAATDWLRGAAHLAASEALVRSLPPASEPFAERYYALVITLFLARGDADRARQWADRGLALFEFSAPIRTASGMVEELVAHLADPECVDSGCAAGGASLVPLRLAAAEREYRVALERDPSLVEARLRLGRVLSLLDQRDEAAAAFARVIETGPPRARYLAYLFRGSMTRGAGNGADARRDYEAAMALDPAGQTARLALSHLAEASGDARRARQLVAVTGRADGSVDPWWIYQNGGLDRDTLQWLIDYVRR